MPDSNHPGVRITHRFIARRMPDRPAGGPRVWDYRPTEFSNLFSADRIPVLTLWPGDSVRTSTIDSGGVDAQGVTRALFGNPQTGPFFIASAEPGDTLVVHLKRLALNRDWADSLDTIVGRALGTSLVATAGELGKPVRWKLDRAAGFARPEGADRAEALKATSTGLIQWLQQDYGLTLSQAAQVLGSSVRYNVPNLAGRSVGVAARLDKAVLPKR